MPLQAEPEGALYVWQFLITGVEPMPASGLLSR